VDLKKSKLNVEEDEGTGSTPKLAVARRRLHAAGADAHGGGRGRPPPLATASDTNSVNRLPLVSLRTDLLDMHLYAILNWVFCLMYLHPGMHSF
jgi:hypothetical protein